MKPITFLLIILIRFVKPHNLFVNVVNVECLNFNPSTMHLFECELFRGKNYKNVLTARYAFTRDVSNITGKFTLEIQRKEKKEIRNSFTFDYCKSLATADDNYLMQIYAKEMRRSSNLPRRCPLKKGVIYTVENFTTDGSRLPPYIPQMEFALHMEFFYDGVKTMVIIPRGRIMKLKSNAKRA